MKTYREKNKELESKLRDLQTRFHSIIDENNLRKKVIEDNNLFDPIKYKEIFKKLSITVDALESIRFLELQKRLDGIDLSKNPLVNNIESKTIIEAICCEAIEQIREGMSLKDDLT